METKQQELENENLNIKKIRKLNKKGIAVLFIFIIVIIMIIMAIMGVFKKDVEKEEKKEEIKNVTENYVAYIKINPSIKLEYSRSCIDNKCENPIVNNYKLVNTDAIELFKDIDLLQNEKDLSYVLELICDEVLKKGIEFDTVEIYSDWNKLDNYLNTKQDTTKWSYKINLLNSKQIDDTIKSDIEEEKVTKDKEKEEDKDKEEELAKEESSKKENVEKENKAKERVEGKSLENNSSNKNNSSTDTNNEKTTSNEKSSTDTKQNRDSTVIYLSDGVSYYQSGGAYCCVDCFSDELINELRSAKGYFVNIADSCTIDFIKISKLSPPYNSSTYFGVDLVSKIEAAGGENCASFGNGPEPLTVEVCDLYNLSCE